MGVGGDEELGDMRLGLRGHLSDASGVDRDVADMGESAVLALYLPAYFGEDGRPRFFVFRKKGHSSAISTSLGNRNSLEENEFMRDLDHDSGTVAGLSVRPFRSAVPHVLEHRQSIFNKFVSFVAAYVYDHTHPTGIMFVACIV